MVVLQSSITCYICNANVPYDTQQNAFICPVCKKVWIKNILKPTHAEPSYIPGAKKAMGGKSSKGQKNEKMKKPTVQYLNKCLYYQT